MKKSALIIGQFTRAENGVFTGKLETLAISKTITLQPNDDNTKDSHPDYVIHTPLKHHNRWIYTGAEPMSGNVVATVHGDSAEGRTRLLATAYNAFDAAARKLGVNAVLLAEAMQDGAFLTEVVDNADLILYHMPHLDKAAFDAVSALVVKAKVGAS